MTALPSTVAFYLSEDDVLDEGDAFVGNESVKTLELAGEEPVPLNLRLPASIARPGSSSSPSSTSSTTWRAE